MLNLIAAQSQDFSHERCRQEGKGKEVQFQMLISVPQITAVPGFVTFSDKIYIQCSDFYIGLHDMVQTPDLN